MLLEQAGARPHRMPNGWKDVNVQPSREEERPPEFDDEQWERYLQICPGVCPHFQLLCVGAELLGITEPQLSEERAFCGKHIVGVNNLGFLSGRRGDEYVPEMFCCRLTWSLHQAIRDIGTAQSADLDELMKRLRDNLEDEKASRQFLGTLETISRGLRAASALMKNIPPASLVEGSRERTSEEALRYATDILQAVMSQVTGEPGARPMCPQAPTEGFFGMVS